MGNKSNKILSVVIIILLVVVIGLLVYVAFFKGKSGLTDELFGDEINEEQFDKNFSTPDLVWGSTHGPVKSVRTTTTVTPKSGGGYGAVQASKREEVLTYDEKGRITGCENFHCAPFDVSFFVTYNDDRGTVEVNSPLYDIDVVRNEDNYITEMHFNPTGSRRPDEKFIVKYTYSSERRIVIEEVFFIEGSITRTFTHDENGNVIREKVGTEGMGYSTEETIDWTIKETDECGNWISRTGSGRCITHEEPYDEEEPESVSSDQIIGYDETRAYEYFDKRKGVDDAKGEPGSIGTDIPENIQRSLKGLSSSEAQAVRIAKAFAMALLAEEFESAKQCMLPEDAGRLPKKLGLTYDERKDCARKLRDASFKVIYPIEGVTDVITVRFYDENQVYLSKENRWLACAVELVKRGDTWRVIDYGY